MFSYEFDGDNNNDDQNYWKDCDHYHYTGKLKDAAHSICNLRYRVTK